MLKFIRKQESDRPADSPVGAAEGKPFGRPANNPGRGAALFVWTIWALMVLAALVYVSVNGADVPFMDDWNMVPVLVKDEPVTFGWLWSEYNGHRLPLPKFVLLALYRLTSSDFRAGMYLNVLALGALAFVLIRTAGFLRGRVSYADAFFPLALLHWGHGGMALS